MNQTSYTAEEPDMLVSVCIEVVSGSLQDIDVFVGLQTVQDANAEGGTVCLLSIHCLK